MATATVFAAAARARACRCNAPFSSRAAAQLEQPDQRLGVLRLVEDRVELGERPDLDVDALVLVDLGARRRRERPVARKTWQTSSVKPGEVKNVCRCSQLGGGLADLLGELALGGLQRRLALDVELAGRDLEQVGGADRLARLAHEPERLAVVDDDADRAGVADDLARRPPRRPRGGSVSSRTVKILPS